MGARAAQTRSVPDVLLKQGCGYGSTVAARGCKVYGPVFSQVCSAIDYFSGLPDEAVWSSQLLVEGERRLPRKA